MISQELKDWVRKRNKEDLKEWIAKKYEDEYKDDLTSSDWDDYDYPSKDNIYEWLRKRLSKEYGYYTNYRQPRNSQSVKFEEWLLEIHSEEWKQDTIYNHHRNIRYSKEYQEIKREYQEIIKLENQIDAEELKLNDLDSYSDRYDCQSREVGSLIHELNIIKEKSDKYSKGLSETKKLRSIRRQKYASLQRESLHLQRKPFHFDPILYALLIHANDLLVPTFAFPIHLKILVKGSIVYGRLISERTYTSLMLENLSAIDNFLHCDFNQEVSYYNEVSGELFLHEVSSELYLHLDTDGYKDIDTDPMFRYIRISIHDVDGFSICQFNSLSEDP
jgi:hypothetical protein